MLNIQHFPSLHFIPACHFSLPLHFLLPPSLPLPSLPPSRPSSLSTSSLLPAVKVKGYDRLKYFQESAVYWAPATTTSGLYTQLYENKYRELPRNQIM